MTSEAGLGIRAAVSGDRIARVFEVRGVVQGVGFRPFVWRLATELGLDGSVVNRAGQVEIRVAGLAESVEAFVGRIRTDAPARARVEDIVVRDGDLEIAPGSGFTIDESARGRNWVTFTGSAKQMEGAFNTRIHEFVVNGESHYATVNEPAVPRALLWHEQVAHECDLLAVGRPRRDVDCSLATE